MIRVVLEGGIVQAVVSDKKQDLGKIVEVIDYDTDGADEENLTGVKQSDGSISTAIVYDMEIQKQKVKVVG